MWNALYTCVHNIKFPALKGFLNNLMTQNIKYDKIGPFWPTQQNVPARI